MVIKKPDPTHKTFGRKSYVEGEHDDYKEMIRRPTRRGMDAREGADLTPWSQMDKPYASPGYQEMEHYEPMPMPFYPSGINISVNPFPGPLPIVGGDWDVETDSSIICSLSFLDPMYCCCKNSGGEFDVEAKPTHLPSRGPCVLGIDVLYLQGLAEAMGVHEFEARASVLTRLIVWHNGKKCYTEAIGGPWPLKVYPNEDTEGRRMWHPGDEVSTTLKLTSGDKVSYTCQHRHRISCSNEDDCDFDCCTDKEYVAVSIDTEETPETITPGGSITVTILDGCPPFTWTVGGTGFTFANETTQGRTNTLSCDSGSCGSAYDEWTQVTVTDDCENSAKCTIKADTGRWSSCFLSSSWCYDVTEGYEILTESPHNGAPVRFYVGCWTDQAGYRTCPNPQLSASACDDHYGGTVSIDNPCADCSSGLNRMCYYIFFRWRC